MSLNIIKIMFVNVFNETFEHKNLFNPNDKVYHEERKSKYFMLIFIGDGFLQAKLYNSEFVLTKSKFRI